MNRVYAVLGPAGTFTGEAALRYWGEDVRLAEMGSIEEVFQAVVENRVAGGMVPLENTLTGSIAASMDNLEQKSVFIAGEIYLSINHCLLAAAGTTLQEIELVVSQFQALRQCEGFVRARLPLARREIVESTARAAQVVRSETRPAAAIGPDRMASIYGLTVIARGIQDHDNNRTRFVHISSAPVLPENGTKTSLLLSLPNKPGILCRAMGVLAGRGISIAKIETYPGRERLNECRFFLDIKGTPADRRVASALNELCQISTRYRFLGSYADQAGGLYELSSQARSI